MSEIEAVKETQETAQEKPLPTIWEVPDELWEKILPILEEYDPPRRTGRKRIDPRSALNAMIYRMRTSCQWNHLPKEFPDDSSVHRTFQRWVEHGVFEKVWATLVEACDELGGVDWEWQSADASMGKARSGGIRSAPIRPTEARRE